MTETPRLRAAYAEGFAAARRDSAGVSTDDELIEAFWSDSATYAALLSEPQAAPAPQDKVDYPPLKKCHDCVNLATKRWSHEYGWYELCDQCYAKQSAASVAATSACGAMGGSTSAGSVLQRLADANLPSLMSLIGDPHEAQERDRERDLADSDGFNQTASPVLPAPPEERLPTAEEMLGILAPEDLHAIEEWAKKHAATPPEADKRSGDR